MAFCLKQVSDKPRVPRGGNSQGLDPPGAVHWGLEYNLTLTEWEIHPEPQTPEAPLHYFVGCITSAYVAPSIWVLCIQRNQKGVPCPKCRRDWSALWALLAPVIRLESQPNKVPLLRSIFLIEKGIYCFLNTWNLKNRICLKISHISLKNYEGSIPKPVYHLKLFYPKGKRTFL